MQGSGHGVPGRCFLMALRLFVMVFLLGMPPGSGTAHGEGTFDQETCSLCHIRDSVYIDPAYLSGEMREVFDEERVCMSCHNGSVRDSRRSLWRGEQHPALPGEGKGQSPSCSACHSPHEKGGWEVLRHTAVRLFGGGDPICTGCHKRYRSRGAGLHENGFPSGGCAECHQAHGGTGKALLRAPKESICHRCHEAQGSNRSGGHPVATLKGGKASQVPLPGCTACHPVHRGGVPGDSVEKRCAECHEADLRSPGTQVAHRPGETCLSCHSFHTSTGAGGRGLRKSDMDPSVLCGNCHGEVIAKKQEEAKRRGTHPVEDPEGKEKDLCLRCHRMHKAAPDTAMLATNKPYFCLECHEEQNTIREPRGILLAHPVFERIAEGRLAAAAKKYRLILGPSSEIVCGTCHSIHRSVPGTALLEKGFDQAGNCFLCHEALRGVRHQRSADRARDPGCASCHKVHGMRTGKGDPWKEVCSSCHLQQMAHLPGREDRKINRPGEMPGFDERGRTVEVGGGISCPTCHDPHGASEAPTMLRKAYRSSGFLCTACHRDKETVALTTHDLRGIAGNAICEPCHRPHGGSSPWMWGMKRGEGDPADESCRSCHRQKGMGFPVPDGGHPSGMIVVRPLPDRFPLYGEEWKVSRTGLMTCSTCHQVHGDASAPRGGDRNPLLRSASPTGEGIPGEDAFCRNCHILEPVSHRDTSCSACHSTHPKKQAEGCDTCHSALAKGVAALHLGKGSTCRDCHRIHGDGGAAKLVARCTACHTRTERIRGTPHADIGEMICDPCHPSHREPDNTVVGRRSYEEVFRPDQSCLRCHNDQGIGQVPGWMEHPQSRKQVPTNYGAMVVLETPIHMTGRLAEGNRPLFPLFDADGNRSLSGRMGCLTCHDPHLGTIGTTGGGGRSASAYLRDPSGIFLSEICVPCHRSESGEHAVSFHKLPRKAE